MLSPLEEPQTIDATARNGVVALRDPDQTVHQLFEAQARRSPEAIAVVAEDPATGAEIQVTYRQLNARANQLAHYLRRNGVGADVLVGVCMNRSVEMIVGLLGILKAGGGYVPLDPDYPKARLAFFIEDTRVPLILTQSSLCAAVASAPAKLVALDTDWADIANESVANPAVRARDDNVVYVMYTSGSTGTPKGVVVLHRGVCNYLLWRQSYFPLDATDRVLQKTSFSFVDSVWELFEPLTVGARLIMVAPSRHHDLAYLVRVMAEKEITAADFIPSLLDVFLDERGVEKCTTLRRVTTGSETVSVELEKRFFARLDASLYNLYGPTEASIASTCWTCSAAAAMKSVPIGRPIANTEVILLDADLQRVPRGQEGEVYIGGTGLARGYLNRPAQTGDSFVPNPDSGAIPGTRLYRTGDLAGYVQDYLSGEPVLAFLGRIDHQVKLRGYRFELGEVECALRRHPHVQAAVAVLREDRPRDKCLIAYVVFAPGQDVAVAVLRSYLKEDLPDYMIPAVFVFLDQLPLTPNGKVDRKALPVPDQKRVQRAGGFASPRTPVEALLADIWAEILRIDDVGIHDDFLDLGGHSLLAIRVVSRVQTCFGLTLPVRVIFESPTVAALAKHIESGEQDGDNLRHLPITRMSRLGRLPLSFAQQRLWFLSEAGVGGTAYNMQYRLHLVGPLQIVALQSAIREILRRHEPLRTVFRSEDGVPYQVINCARDLEFPISDLSDLGGETKETIVARLMAQDYHRPFDLENDMMVRVRLLRMTASKHIFLFTVHHIAFDGSSAEIVARELAALYHDYHSGRPSSLPAIDVHYADFAAWQRHMLQGEILETYITYWRAQLDGAPTHLNLQSDRPRPRVQTYTGDEVGAMLAPRLGERLRALSRKENATLFMTLLAGFKLLMSRLCGQSDVIFGIPVEGRSHAQVENLVGFFVNTLVTRTDLSGDPTFNGLLRSVRNSTIEAYSHQDLPFEKLVETLAPERVLSRSPFFQVFFNMTTAEGTGFSLKDLRVKAIPKTSAATHFDITLYVLDRPPELRVNLVYNADLFAADRMDEVLRQYAHLLEQLSTSPEACIHDYNLVTVEAASVIPDPRVVLTAEPLPTVAEMLNGRVAEAAHKTALSRGDRRWSYQDVASMAESIARRLRSEGLESGDIVALHGSGSFGLVVGLVGVFMAGGVAMPIDSELPDNRKNVILQEGHATYLLEVVAPENPSRWADAQSLPTVLIDEDRGIDDAAAPDRKSQHERLSGRASSSAAYVFFTSGSTGTPKAVLGSHAGLSHFLNWQRATFDVGPGDRVAQLTSLSFDVVLRDILLPLVGGATLVVPPPSQTRDADSVLQWLRQEAVTVLHTVPSIAIFWLTHASIDMALPKLRVVFFAGEPLSADLVDRWRRAFTYEGDIVNLYGPTETTLAKCWYRVPRRVHPGIQPIGTTLPQTQILILSAEHRLCGIGEPGEIAIRTPYRSLGYRNNPEETARTFIQNPFRDAPDDLIYLTGDRGCYRHDGLLDISGRMDDQVKIRGVRIEPDEINQALRRHPLVKTCFVAAVQDDEGGSKLIAYVTTDLAEDTLSYQLHSYLAGVLPAAMIPSFFVKLVRLPLTANGKVDRRALPAVDMTGNASENTFIAPSSPTEERLAAIWIEVLGIDSVGIHDNFFDRGGHSLLAIQIISRIRKAFCYLLPVSVLFERPTISGLAQTIESAQVTGHAGPTGRDVARATFEEGAL